jgi:hypothetical protein
VVGVVGGVSWRVVVRGDPRPGGSWSEGTQGDAFALAFTFAFRICVSHLRLHCNDGHVVACRGCRVVLV